MTLSRPMLALSVLTAALLLTAIQIGCSKQPESKKPAAAVPQGGLSGTGPISDSARNPLNALPPKYDYHYILDERSNTVFGIDLNTNKVAARLLREEAIVAVQFDPARNWLYEAVDKPAGGVNIFDVKAGRYLQKFRFPDPPAALFYHPIQQRLYVVSRDSSTFRVFHPDSMKFTLKLGLNIQNKYPIEPLTLGPGPAGKLITANGKPGSVTQIFTENNFMYQTVVIHDAVAIDQAFFSLDGNSSYSCDTEHGSVYRVEFGSGKVLGELHGLNRPRFIQLEISSNTVVVALGKAELLMMNADTFRETGRVDLSPYGDDVLRLEIPPKANFAEVLMDYKGVTRWIRFDLQTWETLRLVELI